MKKKLIAVLLALLFAAIGYLIGYASVSTKTQITGTYSGAYEEGFSYLVIEKEGKYTLYYPNEEKHIIDTGTYKQQEKELFLLQSNLNKSNYLIRIDAGVYFIDSSTGKVFLFTKQTDDIYWVTVSHDNS